MFGVDELGLDLGTSTLHMVVQGKGIVLSEPAYVTYDRQTRDVVAVCEEARRRYGRTPASTITSTSGCRSLGAMPPGSASSSLGRNAARLPTTLRMK